MANQQHKDRGENVGQQAGSQTSSGGRGERQAGERQQEQAESDTKGGKQIPPSTKTVKSEPHWDPAESTKSDASRKSPE